MDYWIFHTSIADSFVIYFLFIASFKPRGSKGAHKEKRKSALSTCLEANLPMAFMQDGKLLGIIFF